jgi:hypothetical protein
MAIKHQTIRPVRHAGVAGQSKIYQAGAAVIAGAPCIFSSGQAVAATDAAGSPAGRFIGFSEHAAAAQNDDLRIALCTPGAEFVGSLTSLAAGGTDAGAKALAISDIGTLVELHVDAGTAKWVLGATGGDDAPCMITGLIDPVGATTDDAPTFGAVGGGGVGATGAQDPTGSNSGMALVKFQIVTHTSVTTKVKTIY